MNYPTVDQFRKDQQVRSGLLMFALVFTVMLIVGIVGAFVWFNVSWFVAVLAALGVFFVCSIPVLVWNNPKYGFYTLFFGTMVFEGVTNGYGASSIIPTSYVPFFWNLNNLGQQYGTGALNPFKFSIAEGVMLLTFISWIIRQISLRDLHIEKGAFFGWFAAYIGMVAFGAVHGIATGGDASMALWEVRSQFHMFLSYLIACNVIKEKKDVMPVLWLAVIGIGMKGLIGIYAYIQMIAAGMMITEQGVLTHEESLFFNVLIFICLVSWLSNSDKKIKWISLILVPFCIFTALQNQRRSGIAALIVALLPLMFIMWSVLEDRKVTIKRFVIGLAIVNALYLPLAWNAQGAWALPARAIRSNTDPNERDASSDYYRMVENINLKATRDRSPIIGIGYGKPYDMLIYQPGIEQFDAFLKYLPHNSIMWIWMRIGHVGFFCFMMILATVCIKGTHILKQTQDVVLQTIGSIGLVVPLMLFTFGKFDMAMVNYRIVIMTGSFMGILAVLRKLDPTSKEYAEAHSISRTAVATVDEIVQPEAPEPIKRTTPISI